MGILHTPTQVHTVICMQTSTHRHTHSKTHTPPKTENKLHHKSTIPQKSRNAPFFPGGCLFHWSNSDPDGQAVPKPSSQSSPWRKERWIFNFIHLKPCSSLPENQGCFMPAFSVKYLCDSLPSYIHQRIGNRLS